MRKKVIIAVTGIIVFFLIYIVFMQFFVRQKSQNNLEPQNEPQSTISEYDDQPKFKKDNIMSVKQKLQGTFVYKDITLDYAPDSDTIIIFYNGPKANAEQRVFDFFNKEGIENLQSQNITYYSLSEPDNNPPREFLD